MTTAEHPDRTITRRPRFAIARRRVRVGRRRMPVWAALLALYGVSRVVTTAVLAGIYAIASAGRWSTPGFASFAGYSSTPSFGAFLESWDGLWYRHIALGGYPTVMPVDATGAVQKNPWAFLPVFPTMVRLVMTITGLPFEAAGPIVAAVFGAAATVMLYALLRPRTGTTAAFWGALLFCFGPLSFVLQTGYAESVYLFFMFASLAAMAARRYLLMLPLAVVACFTHPGGIALALALAIHGISRLAHHEPFPTAERVKLVVTGAIIAVAGVGWPVVAGIVTGAASAYFDSEFAWWRDYLGDVHFLPFSPWFLFTGTYFGVAGPLVVIGVLALLAWWLARRGLRAGVGRDVVAYSGSYLAYLVAVFLPQQSLFRMLLPLSPLLGHPVLSRTAKRRRVLLAVSIALQPVGILLFWVIWPP